MNRRQLLKASVAGGSVVAGGLIAVDRLQREEPPPPSEPEPTTPTGTPTSTPEEPAPRFAEEFGTVVNVVEAGADPDGAEPINSILEEHAGDDTLLSFPEGTYLLEPIQFPGFHHLGLAAAGEARPSIVPPSGMCRSGPYIRFDGVSGFLVDRMDFDFREPDAGGEIRIVADGDATVRDVWAAGGCDRQVALFRLDVIRESATGLVENFRAENPRNDPSLTCVYVGKSHAGELTFRNCDLAGFSDNGLYASAPGQEEGRNGTVHVDGGLYENNNVSNVRLGSTGSTARGVEISADTPPKADSVNVRGIRLRERGDQLIDDCTIYIGADAGNSFGGIVFHPANRGAIIQNTSITVDREFVPAIRAFHREEGATEQRFEGVTMAGNAARGFAGLIQGRDETVFKDCTIEQTGEQRGGLRISYSENCRIEGCTIDVTQEPIVLRQSSATVVNTTLRTPAGERHIDHLEAKDGDFSPR